MSTRSIISIENSEDNYDAIYCHFDGYLSGVGACLFIHYKNERDIRELISRGDASFIRGKIDKCEFFTQRGEDLHIKRGITLQELKNYANDIFADYLYVYHPKEEAWHYLEIGSYRRDITFLKLTRDDIT